MVGKVLHSVAMSGLLRCSCHDIVARYARGRGCEKALAMAFVDEVAQVGLEQVLGGDQTDDA